MPNKIYNSKTALTGGAAGALDYIDGDLLADGDIAHVFVSGVLYTYKLNGSSSAAESSPYVIVPDTNPGTKRWELQTPDVILPWVIDIDVFAPFPAAWQSTFYTKTVDNTILYAGWIGSDPAGVQNNYISWPVILAKGTWTVYLTHIKNGNVGIYSVQIDDVEQGTIDGYDASETPNQEGSVASIAIAYTGKYTLKFKMATKNGSSSAYYGIIQHVRLARTA